jgi:anti-anti-sigma factor
MGNVEFIDSTGVGLLTHWRKQIEAAGGHLVLVAPGPAVRRALALLRIESFFAMAPDAAAAAQLLELRAREQAAGIPSGASTGPLVWQGEITAVNAQEIWKRTAAQLASPGASSPSKPPERVLDLSAVRFIDSSGLGVLVRAKRLVQSQGARLVLTGLQPAVQNVVQLARLDLMGAQGEGA